MLLLAVLPATAAAETVAAAIIRVEHPRPLPISRLDLPPADLGLAGARLATEDNNTTGRFMGQEFTLEEVTAPPEEAVAALEALLGQGVRFVATLADADTTLALADAAGDRALILNALAPDDRLRGADCRANLLHLAPSRSMLTDALAQYLAVKRWTDWLARRRLAPRRPAARRGLPPRGREVRRGASSRRGPSRIPAAPAAPTPATSRSRRRCRSSPSARPTIDVLIAADENQVFAA